MRTTLEFTVVIEGDQNLLQNIKDVLNGSEAKPSLSDLLMSVIDDIIAENVGSTNDFEMRLPENRIKLEPRLAEAKSPDGRDGRHFFQTKKE